MTDAEINKARALATKMADCRDGAKVILRERYCAKMQEWGNAIKEVASQHKITNPQAAIVMAKQDQDGGMTTILIMAALCEILEPSPECGT
jgi:hypothetical protein